MMGINTNFATQTEVIAAIGRREIGRGIFILAKEAPRSTVVSGMAMAPRKAAAGRKQKGSVRCVGRDVVLADRYR